MSRALVGLLLLLGGCFLGYVGTWGSGGPKHKKVSGPGAASAYLPAVLDPGPGARGAVRQMKLRALVDQDYRRRTHWREHVSQQLETIDDFLTAAFAVTLAIEIRPYERRAGGDLDAILTELEAVDPGDDVHLVVAFVAAAPTVTISHHHLGMAKILGRHFVVRAMNDAGEARRIDEMYQSLTEADRLQLYEARKVHKEIVVFLHEWAHTLGAIHEVRPEWIMHTSYANEARHFSEANARVIELSLAMRLGTEAEASAAAQALARHLASAQWGDWVESERRALADALPASEASRAAAMQPPAAAAGTVEVVKLFERADELAKADPPSAFPVLEQIRTRVTDPAERVALADRYFYIGALSRVEELLAGQADENADRLREAARARRRHLGMHAIAAEEEPHYALAYEKALSQLQAERFADVARTVRRELSRFRDAPGLLGLLCASEAHRGRGVRTCERALSRWDETTIAHFYAGQVKAQAGRLELAAHHFERLIELDPEAERPWEMLAEVYRRKGDKQALRELGMRYRQRFHRSLP